MTDAPTRRDVLRRTAAATTVGAATSTQVSAEPDGRLRVVEAGLRYDVPDEPSLQTGHVDSRPPYTVNAAGDQILVDDDVRSEFTEDALRKGALAAEVPTALGTRRELGDETRLTELPVGLTSRMRSRGYVSLASEIETPAASVMPTGEATKLVVAGERTRRVEAGSSVTIELDPETVTARTVRVGERVDRPDIPNYQRARQLDFDTTRIEVTPVFELVDHGRVDLVRTPMA